MIRRALGVNSGRFVSRIRDGDRTRCGESARATRHGFSHSSGGRRQREGSAESGEAIRSRPARRSKFGFLTPNLALPRGEPGRANLMFFHFSTFARLDAVSRSPKLHLSFRRPALRFSKGPDLAGGCPLCGMRNNRRCDNDSRKPVRLDTHCS